MSDKLSKKAVLLLDDQRYMHELIRPALIEMSFECLYTKTVSDACDKLDSLSSVDVILCDIDLGGASGLDFVAQVRDARKIANIPIIMLTQYTDQETIDRAMAAGADDYIVKPFKLQRVVDAINLWSGLGRSGVTFGGLTKEKARLARLTMAMMGRSVDAAKTGEALPFEALRENCLFILNAGHDSDIFAALNSLKNKNAKVYLHSIKVAAYLGIIAADLGLSKDDVLDAITAGLLHDIGMARISPEYYENEFLSDDEYKEVVRQHIDFARSILKEQPKPLPKIVTDIATLHHERLDGSGPLGVSEENLPALVRAMCIVDEFLERKSGPWCEHMPSYRIIEAIENDAAFDAELVKSVKALVKGS